MLHGLPPTLLPYLCSQGAPAWNAVLSVLCLPVKILPLCDQIHKARGDTGVHAMQSSPLPPPRIAWLFVLLTLPLAPVECSARRIYNICSLFAGEICGVYKRRSWPG